MHEEEAGWLSQYLHLLGNPAHWAFELTLILLIDVLILAILVPFGRKWLANHDRTAHGKEVCEHDSVDSAA